MKLQWDNFTLGGGPNFFLDGELTGLSGQLQNIVINIPRTDYTKNVDDFLTPKLFFFTGTLIGDDPEDYREKKREFANELRKEFTFTLIDDIVRGESWYTPVDTRWRKRIKLTIPASAIGGDLTDQDVYVNLSNLPASFFTDILSDGADIAITETTSQTKLLRLLENLSIGGQSGDLYFTAPFISSTVDTDFYIYYNNPAGEEVNDGTKVSPVTTVTIHGIETFESACFSFTFAKYEFDGKLVAVDPNIDIRSNKGRYQIQIAAPDPFLRQLPAIVEQATITLGGWIYPKIYSHVYAGDGNSITITNTGGVDVYPVIVLTGGFTDLTIRAENSLLANKDFEYNAAVVSGDFITLNPIPNEPIKAKDSAGNSVVQNTNDNFEALKLQPGVNTFTFFTTGGIDVNTDVSFSYNPTFIGI